MAVDSTVRKISYTGDGSVKSFSFPFVVFDPSDPLVYVSTDSDGSTSAQAKYEQDYTVALNADQDNSPGGTVTFATAPASGEIVSILSGIPETQPMVLTTHDGFDPRVLNKSADRAVALIQQLSERLDRAIVVSPTSTYTAEELKQKLLDAANNATVVAKGYAEAAKQSASEAATSEASAAASAEAAANTLTEAEAAIAAEADSESGRVVEATDGQIERIEAAGDNEIFKQGLGNMEQVWTLGADLASGGALTLPNGLTYLVGRHHLRLSWNGLLLYPGRQFEEVGDSDTASSSVRVLMPMQVGDELDAWVGVLGNGEVAGAIEAANAAQDAVAELSRKVVYKEES